MSASASAGMGVSAGAVNELRGWGFGFGWPKNKKISTRADYDGLFWLLLLDLNQRHTD